MKIYFILFVVAFAWAICGYTIGYNQGFYEAINMKKSVEN